MGANLKNHPLGSKLLTRSPHNPTELARFARRVAVLAALAQHPRLRDGLASAGLSWPACKAMCGHRGFAAALREIIQSHRAAGAIKRRAADRLAIRFELQRAGLSRAVAHDASHQVIAPPQSHADAIQGII